MLRILTLVVVFLGYSCRAESEVGGKRGAVEEYATAGPIYVGSPIRYAAAPQHHQRGILVPQQYFTPAAYKIPAAAAAGPVYYAAAPQASPQQYAGAPQPVQHQPIYAAVPAKYAIPAAKVPIKYSAAGDVSSFSYSSPVVAYNSLGYLTQLAGNAIDKQAYALAPVPAKVAPSSAAYTKTIPVAAYQQSPYYAAVPVAAAQPAAASHQHSHQLFAAIPQPQQPVYATAPASGHNVPHGPAIYAAAPAHHVPQVYAAAPVHTRHLYAHHPPPGITYAH